MSTDLKRASFLVLVLVAGVAAAQTPEADVVRDRLVLQANQAVTELFRQHCPDRCQLLEVKADVEVGAPLAHVQPGFEELSPAVRDVKPRSLDVSVLLDARLPAEFRRDLVALLKARLKPLPVPSAVRADVVAFPQPLPPTTPPGLAPAPPPVAPQVEPPRMEQKPEPPPPPPFEPAKALQQRLIEASPWLLGILLVAFAAWMILRALRPAHDDGDEDESAAPEVPETPSKAAAPELPIELLVRRVQDELRDNPRLRLGAFREMISTGHEERFASYVQLLGPAIADGLREDPVCKAALRRVGAQLRAGAVEVPADEARRLLKELEGRLLADRLEGGGGGLEDAFAFLDRLTPAQFRRLLGGVSARAQGAALRFAPTHLREAALEGLEPARRRALFLSTAEGGHASTPELTELADELRLNAARLAPEGEAGGLELLTDLLDSQAEPEQIALLDALAAKPAMRQALLARLVNEATLGAADDDALAAAAAEIELGALAEFLRGADAELRDRFLAACPRPTANALKEELSISSPFVPARFAAARRQVLKAARRVLLDRGVALEELNASSLRKATG